MKFIHCADLHLDSPMRGLERYEGAPIEALRGATRRAFEELVRIACSEDVDFVLIAGDVFDGEWKDYNTGLFFARQLRRLVEAEIPVILLRGNHDAASLITRQLTYPKGVKELSTSKPETFILEDLGVAIHGQGFEDRAVVRDLSIGYPAPRPGYFNIGMLHTCLDGREGHDRYAPCDANYLRNQGYDYWALGHIHKSDIPTEAPWIVFPGNIQGRHARETGPKGCVMVEVRDGVITGVTPRALDVVRWEHCRIDLTGAADGDECLVRIQQAVRSALAAAGDRLLAVRVEATGACGAHGELAADQERYVAEVRRLALDLGDERIWVEKVRLVTSATAQAQSASAEELDEIMQSAAELARDPELAARLLARFDDLRARLPQELRGTTDTVLPEDAGALQALLPEVAQLLAGRLLHGGSRG